jgi:death on curing protein
MISLKETEEIHSLVIEMFGGSHGIRDHNALESALARPFQTFANQDLYSNILQKAASLIESVLVNHPFIDGNKRTGYILMRMFLIQNGLDITANQEEKYDFVIKIALGDIKFDEIVIWLDKNTSIKNIS